MFIFKKASNLSRRRYIPVKTVKREIEKVKTETISKEKTTENVILDKEVKTSDKKTKK